MAKKKQVKLRTGMPQHQPKSSKTLHFVPAPFPIIGIGASAGGLEALELFLTHVPVDSGLAYVIVQHLDSNHKSIMVELLQHKTSMPVMEITDRMTIAANHVYLIPPGYDLSILSGVLHLLEPIAPHGLRLSIDFFFRSLADDQQQQSIGVILSGMGSDGTLGLRAIKEKAGAVFVQEPATAKFDSMPRSAISTGQVDVIASAQALPGRIIAYLQHNPRITQTQLELTDNSSNALEKIIILLRTQTGHDFSLYKKSTVYRRIERRIALHQLPAIMDYVRYLRENPREVELLFKELLIGVTRFFRDPAAWEQLKNKAISALRATYPNGSVLRAWVAGCSTGEEAYSLAMIFKEALEEKVQPSKNLSLQIFATDLDKEAIDKARQGIYAANIVADVSETRLHRFFQEEEQGYRVKKEIREMLIFAKQNLIMDPPFTKLHLVVCRNFLIYIEPELQQKLLTLFHYSLIPNGILLLGSAETIGPAKDLFTPLAAKTRLYQRRESAGPVGRLEFPTVFASQQLNKAQVLTSKQEEATPNLPVLANRLLLQLYAPAAVLVTNQGDILYINGKTGKYLEPAAGKASLNLFVMAREGLSQALSEIFHKALREQNTITRKAVKVGTNGGTQMVDVTVQPITEPVTLSGMVLVVFHDVTLPVTKNKSCKTKGVSDHSNKLAELTAELQSCYEALQITREEMQLSQEDLKSANEELQSTNEELQSTNEELNTSKEEMQSINEELQTVNNELQVKVDELSRVSDDMRNLLNSTDIAILFLDGALNVRRFTNQTASVIKLIPSDVGRPITDLVIELNYPDLVSDARDVLNSLVFKEVQVSAKDGRWFTVRTLPYRTQENRIDGVVIIFTDISVAKRLEEKLIQAQAVLEKRFANQTEELHKVATILQQQEKLK